jgi:hypothetical protein
MKGLLFCFLSAFIFTTSFSQSKGQMHRRLNEASLPKDVLNKDYVLLVKIPFDSKHWIEKYTEAMKEHYAGAFEIVPYKVSIDEAYPDTKKYRYILACPHSLSKKDFTGDDAAVANSTKGLAPTSAWSKDYHMADRQNLSVYWNTNLSAQDEMKLIKYLADRLSGKDEE